MKPAKISYTMGQDGMYHSPGIALPEMKSGNWSIRHVITPPGEKMIIVSMRNAMFMGMKPSHTIAPGKVVTVELRETDDKGDKGWMSDSPQEVEQHTRQLKKARGRVLVGGLGIGLAVAILARNRKVREIVVVEKSSDVIRMVAPHAWNFVGSRSRGVSLAVLNTCLFEYLKMNHLPSFDFAFLDIWIPTGQTVLADTVLPLRKLAKRVVYGPIECWNELDMIGQMRINLQMAIMDKAPIAQHIAHAKKWKRDQLLLLPFYEMIQREEVDGSHVDSYLEAVLAGEHETWRPDKEEEERREFRERCAEGDPTAIAQAEQ